MDTYSNWEIYKFGGTSVATTDRIANVVKLVTDGKGSAGEQSASDVETPDGISSEPHAALTADRPRIIVVVSALGGVTNDLDTALKRALSRDESYSDVVTELDRRHRDIADQVGDESRGDLYGHIGRILSELSELLHGVYLLRECTPRSRDAIMGLGERLSAPLVAAAFRQAGYRADAYDSRRLIRTDDSFGEANVDLAATETLVREQFDDLPDQEIAVVTGFIATNARGAVTTLGRSGSDYTATILGACLKARKVVIWTDVDGVLSADPGIVPVAFTLPKLSYQEAAEMAYFGAKVLHPRTMRPIREKAIPLQIRNTLNPESEGTLIWTDSTGGGEVKAVTSVRGISLLMLEGAGMMGVPGISARMFSALASKEINVLLISQASSEQSICVGVRSDRTDLALETLNDAFELELGRRDISGISATRDCAVVSVVGDQMRMQPGLAGRMFSTLGRANINVLAIAQGAAETNISAVVAASDNERAVRTLHEAFARSMERLHLFLIGPGVVGREFLKICSNRVDALCEQESIYLRLAGLANSSRLVWEPEGIEFNHAVDRLLENGEPMDVESLIQRLVESHLERLVVIDATASSVISQHYHTLLSNGIAVVTPNKKANTGPIEYYDLLQSLSRYRDVPFLYETTVGAAMPVISTLRDLVRSGDVIHRIDAVLSGTLAFVFDQLRQGVTFSEAVSSAREHGYTEPDPREDLGGEDVARKILTLAREAGHRIERADIEVESLVPEELRELSVDAFMDRLSEYNDAWARRAAEGTLHFVGTMDGDRCRVGVTVLTEDSPFVSLKGSDNMVVFSTGRYSNAPLVISGAGAGPDITASGVFADVLKAAVRMV